MEGHEEGPLGESEEMEESKREAPGLCGCEECAEPDQVQYVSTSVAQRGNRNKALLLKERRELQKEKRTNGYKRCDKVNSKDVDKKWVQDRNQKMVIIGSDAVSLYPSLTKQESADEVANAVLESGIKFEGVNWKEATRFLVLGRDETWCRSSKLWRVLPRRKFKHGTRPGLTGAGPLGADVDNENPWEFMSGARLTEQDKRVCMAEVMRLAVEIMFSTHVYSFGGHCYKQEGGWTYWVEIDVCSGKSSNGEMGHKVERKDEGEQPGGRG